MSIRRSRKLSLLFHAKSNGLYGMHRYRLRWRHQHLQHGADNQQQQRDKTETQEPVSHKIHEERLLPPLQQFRRSVITGFLKLHIYYSHLIPPVSAETDGAFNQGFYFQQFIRGSGNVFWLDRLTVFRRHTRFVLPVHHDRHRYF